MTPTTTQHTWGIEVVWASTADYSSRYYIIREGDATQLGYHRKRDLTVYVLQGIVQLVLERQSKLLQEGETYHLPPGVFHRLCAVKGDATILEVGTQMVDDFVEVKV